MEHCNRAIEHLVNKMEECVSFTITNIIPTMHDKRENYTTSNTVVDYMFQLGPLLMVAGELIGTCEAVCWWGLRLRL